MDWLDGQTAAMIGIAIFGGIAGTLKWVHSVSQKVAILEVELKDVKDDHASLLADVREIRTDIKEIKKILIEKR